MEEGKQKASDSNEELEKDILHMAEKQIEEKRQSEINKVSEQINKEREEIRMLLGMISERLVFKKDDEYQSNCKSLQ